MKIAILGNSKRLNLLADKLKNDGYNISLHSNGFSLPKSFCEDVIILPIPSLTKQGYINLADDSQITPSELLAKIEKSSLIISCNFYNENYNIVDLNKREDFAFLNAIPTAEAAIIIAINYLGATIYNTKCLICGFGRIGKMLASRLKSLNATVCICARNPKDLAYAKAIGLEVIMPQNLKDAISNYEVVFQTVPTQVLNYDNLSGQKNKPLIIELSSGCVGTDIETAEKVGFNVVDATNLPEKYTPNTAGSILYDVTMKILEENNKTKGGL